MSMVINNTVNKKPPDIDLRAKTKADKGTINRGRYNDEEVNLGSFNAFIS